MARLLADAFVYPVSIALLTGWVLLKAGERPAWALVVGLVTLLATALLHLWARVVERRKGAALFVYAPVGPPGADSGGLIWQKRAPAFAAEHFAAFAEIDRAIVSAEPTEWREAMREIQLAFRTQYQSWIREGSDADPVAVLFYAKWPVAWALGSKYGYAPLWAYQAHSDDRPERYFLAAHLVRPARETLKDQPLPVTSRVEPLGGTPTTRAIIVCLGRHKNMPTEALAHARLAGHAEAIVITSADDAIPETRVAFTLHLDATHKAIRDYQEAVAAAAPGSAPPVYYVYYSAPVSIAFGLGRYLAEAGTFALMMYVGSPRMYVEAAV